jgi:hypothetical protein
MYNISSILFFLKILQGEGAKPSGLMKHFNISGGLYARNPIFCAIVEDPRKVVLTGIRALFPLFLITIHSLNLTFYHFYVVYSTFFVLMYLFINYEKITWQNDK